MFGVAAQPAPLQHGAFILPVGPWGGPAAPGPTPAGGAQMLPAQAVPLRQMDQPQAAGQPMPSRVSADPNSPPLQPQQQGLGEMFAGIAQGLGDLMAGTFNQLQDSLPPPQLDAKEQAVDLVLSEKGFIVARRRQAKQGLPPGALGKGAFGIVYLAGKGGTSYAVKMVEGLSKNKKVIQQEIEILRILDHPSIVNLMCFVTDEAKDWMFIVMDFVDGGDLLASLTQQPQLYDENLMRVMLFHCSCALAYAHQRSVVHRDLKPENILLRKRDCFPKIADFGISRVISDNSICMTMAGTMPYMAPEVSDRSTYTFAADMYSLGRIVTDMFATQRLVSWVPLNMMHPNDQEKFRKHWPAGAGPCNPSPRLLQLHKDLLCEMPGKRPSGYNFCKEMVKLQREEPKEHPLWNEATKAPDGPPTHKGVTQEFAAQIAGSRGYAVGVPVEIQISEGVWVPGTVDHISSGLCPGAAQVKYVMNGNEGSALVCPWQFKDLLRPTARPSSRTITSGSGKSPARSQNSGSVKEEEGGFKKCCSIQ